MPIVILDEIETAIHQLPESEVRKLAARLQGYLDDLWDQQLASDLESGKLDVLIARVERYIAENQVRDLDEILRNP